MLDEKFKDIPGYENLYAINEEGEIWSYLSNKILQQSLANNEYLKVVLYKNGTSKNKMVHRLVAETFLPNPENLPTVDHIDQNKKNNNVHNLRWADFTLQNQNKNNENQKLKSARQANMKKASEAAVLVCQKPVEMRDKNNHSILLQTFNSSCEASRFLCGDNSKNAPINSCAHGNRKSAYGYYWCFKGAYQNDAI